MSSSDVSSVGAFGPTMRRHLEAVEEANGEVLDAVAESIVEVMRADGLLFVSGSGHSVALVLETFYRAGGLACVYPLYHPALLPLHGARVSTLVERSEGFEGPILDAVSPGERDLAVIFSNSGGNPFPVRLAEGLREAGTPVVAVVSVPHMTSVAPRAGRSLGDVAAHVIDTLIPPGDAALQTDGAPMGPLSSLTSVFVWNLLLERVGARAVRDGVTLPVWTSGNVPSGDERNAELMARYRGRIPML
jgi:uncharacterized phosphosugar-binding protein